MGFDNTAPCFMDDLLDFSSDIGEQEDEDETHNNPHLSTFSLYPEFVKEELEWISNKDAFPMVESLVDIMPNHLSFATSISNSSTNSLNNHSHHHQSPISVLENSGSSFSSLGSRSIGNSNNNTNNGSGNMMFINLPSNFKVPGKARSKHGRKRRRDLLGQQFVCWSVQQKPSKKRASYTSKSSSTIGRRCLHCGSEKTPQWRAGPLGPKTLCNACGVRYKSGRLCDEYRPASSPTFSSELHSNSHRKIIEMRKQKVMPASSGLKPAEIGHKDSSRIKLWR